MLSTAVLIYKVVTLGPLVASAATLAIPFWYFLGDIIAEVYGYKMSRRLIWSAIICQFIFAVLCTSLIKLNSPPTWLHQDAYNQVLGSLFRVSIGSFIAVFCGAFINIYALTKWKILLKGRYFWLRSIGATAVGEAIFTVVAFVIEFLGTIPTSQLIQLILASYGIKLFIAPIAATPSSMVATLLKKLEGVDIYDNNTDFNPFKLSLETYGK